MFNVGPHCLRHKLFQRKLLRRHSDYLKKKKCNKGNSFGVYFILKENSLNFPQAIFSPLAYKVCTDWFGKC